MSSTPAELAPPMVRSEVVVIALLIPNAKVPLLTVVAPV